MSNQVIPNTESTVVATTAVAWEIVKTMQLPDYFYKQYDREEAIKRLSNAVLEIRQSLYNNTPIKVGSQDG